MIVQCVIDACAFHMSMGTERIKFYRFGIIGDRPVIVAMCFLLRCAYVEATPRPIFELPSFCPSSLDVALRGLRRMPVLNRAENH